VAKEGSLAAAKGDEVMSSRDSLHQIFAGLFCGRIYVRYTSFV